MFFAKTAKPATMQVTDHARQLLEKHLGLSFLNAGYSGPAPRMNLQQVPRLHSGHTDTACRLCTPSALHAVIITPTSIAAVVRFHAAVKIV